MNQESTKVNNLDIEEVSEELDNATSLLELLNDEINDLIGATLDVLNAKTQQKKQEAQLLLVMHAENRVKYLDVLQTTIVDKVRNQKEALDAMNNE